MRSYLATVLVILSLGAAPAHALVLPTEAQPQTGAAATPNTGETPATPDAGQVQAAPAIPETATPDATAPTPATPEAAAPATETPASQKIEPIILPSPESLRDRLLTPDAQVAPSVEPAAPPAAPRVPETPAVSAEAAAAITIERASTLTPPDILPTAGVFMVITNKSDVPDRLVGITTPAAEIATLNTLVYNDKGTGSLKTIPAVDIKADGVTLLVPSDNSILLRSLTAPLNGGASFPLTLQFERAGPKTVTVDIVSGEELDKRFPPEMMAASLKKMREVEERNARTGKKSLMDRLRDMIRGKSDEQAAGAIPGLPAERSGERIKVVPVKPGPMSRPGDAQLEHSGDLPVAPVQTPSPESQQSAAPIPGLNNVITNEVASPPTDGPIPAAPEGSPEPAPAAAQ